MRLILINVRERIQVFMQGMCDTQVAGGPGGMPMDAREPSAAKLELWQPPALYKALRTLMS